VAGRAANPSPTSFNFMAWNFDSTGTAAQVNAAAALVTGTNATEASLIAGLVTATASEISAIKAADSSVSYFHAVCTGQATMHSAVIHWSVQAVKLGPQGQTLSVSDTHY
jgi:hypothetical protein